MLVLSRHRDESIMIGDEIVVTIVDIRGDKVRLGIDAPQDIPVHRQEVYEAIQRENRKASQLRLIDWLFADFMFQVLFPRNVSLVFVFTAGNDQSRRTVRGIGCSS